MAQLAKGIVGGQMAWGLLGIGAAFGIALLLCGARSPMLIAVGMYLPFDHHVGDFRRRRHASGSWTAMTASAAPKRSWSIEEKGTLLASGLIAGEAIVGILLAVLFLTDCTPSRPSVSSGAGAAGCRFGFAASPTC